jgi:hypothetical protein
LARGDQHPRRCRLSLVIVVAESDDRNAVGRGAVRTASQRIVIQDESPVQRPLLPRLGWLMCRRPGCHLLTVVGMTTTSEALASPADDHDVVLRLATSAYLGRCRHLADPHRVRPAPILLVVRRPTPRAFGPPARTDREVCAVHAGKPPIRTLHGVPAYGRGHRVLPDLRDRRRRGALARRLRPPSPGASRVTIAAAITSRSSPRL